VEVQEEYDLLARLKVVRVVEIELPSRLLVYGADASRVLVSFVAHIFSPPRVPRQHAMGFRRSAGR